MNTVAPVLSDCSKGSDCHCDLLGEQDSALWTRLPSGETTQRWVPFPEGHVAQGQGSQAPLLCRPDSRPGVEGRREAPPAFSS